MGDEDIKDKVIGVINRYENDLDPLLRDMITLKESVDITEKELKATDKSLHTEAYILSIDYQKLIQEINSAKLQSDSNLRFDSPQAEQGYRLYMIISSSLGACHPCSLLVSTYPFEQIKKEGCEIPVTTFYIHDNLKSHSDKSSDHSGKWEISYSDLGDAGTESLESWDKTLFGSSTVKSKEKPSANMTVKSGTDAQSLLGSSSRSSR